MQLAQRHRHVITLVAAALVLHRIRDHDRAPVHASDAELNSDILSAHPLFRRRRTLISIGVDAS
jgi:hypothetical protein